MIRKLLYTTLFIAAVGIGAREMGLPYNWAVITASITAMLMVAGILISLIATYVSEMHNILLVRQSAQDVGDTYTLKVAKRNMWGLNTVAVFFLAVCGATVYAVVAGLF